MRYNVEINPLTPVHIGTGREIGLFEYKIIENHKNAGRFYMRFSPDEVISKMNEKEKELLLKYIENSESEDLKKISGIISGIVNPNDALYIIPASDNFSWEYENKKDKFDTKLSVQEMYRDRKRYVPVIPGSSIKGAIRTAIVSSESKNKNFKQPNPERFEKMVLGHDDPHNDPFRAVQFSDCAILGDNAEFVGEVFNYKEDFNKIQIFQEQLSGILLGDNVKGELELVINKPLQAIRNSIGYGKRRWEPLPMEIDIRKIIDSCNNFYKRNLMNEYNKFYKSTSCNELKINAEKLNELVSNIKPEEQECLVRVGRYSHIENVTDAQYRKPKNKIYGTSRCISEKLYPMGWVKIKFSELKS